MSRYVVLAEFRIRAGDMAAFLDRMAEHARRSREEEPGCLAFDVCVDPERNDVVVLYEVYRDAEAYAAHRALPRYPAFMAAVRPLIAFDGDNPFLSRRVLSRVAPS